MRMSWIGLSALILATTASLARADVGGYQTACNSGNVHCDSGRWLYCSIVATDFSFQWWSDCAQGTGNVGWVHCYSVLSNGTTYADYYDQCP